VGLAIRQPPEATDDLPIRKPATQRIGKAVALTQGSFAVLRAEG